MRAMSAANFSNVLGSIESLVPRLINRLRRANALVEILSMFQAPVEEAEVGG